MIKKNAMGVCDFCKKNQNKGNISSVELLTNNYRYSQLIFAV